MGLVTRIPTHQGQSGCSLCGALNEPTAETNTEPPVWKPISQLVAGWLHRKEQWFVLTGVSSYYDMDLPSPVLNASAKITIVNL